jgi:hypothetical protein
VNRFALGDIVVLKKQHPCGSNTWEITRTGIDFGLRCLGCGRRVMIPRTRFERLVRKVTKAAAPPDGGR